MAANDTSWKPGQSGNPSGRPRKGKSLTEMLQRHGRRRDVLDGERKISRNEALVKKLWALALTGDVPSIKFVFERIDGPTKGEVDVHHYLTDETRAGLAEFFDAVADEVDDGGSPGDES